MQLLRLLSRAGRVARVTLVAISLVQQIDQALEMRVPDERDVIIRNQTQSDARSQLMMRDAIRVHLRGLSEGYQRAIRWASAAAYVPLGQVSSLVT